jgi:hypothetical protein
MNQRTTLDEPSPDSLIGHAHKATANGLKVTSEDKAYIAFVAVLAVSGALATHTFLTLVGALVLGILAFLKPGPVRIYQMPLVWAAGKKHQRSGGITHSESTGVIRQPIHLQIHKIAGDVDEELAILHNTANNSDTVFLFGEGSDYSALTENEKRAVLRKFEQLCRRLWSSSSMSLTISGGSFTRPIDQWQLQAQEIDGGSGLALSLANGYRQTLASGQEVTFIQWALEQNPLLNETELQALVAAGTNLLEINDMVVRDDCEIREFLALTVVNETGLKGKQRQKRRRKGMSKKEFRRSVLIRLLTDARTTLESMGVQGIWTPNLAELRRIANSALSLTDEYHLWQAHYPQTANELREETIKRLGLPSDEKRWTHEESQRFERAGGASRHWPGEIVETDENCVINGSTYHSTILLRAIPEKYILPSFWMNLNTLPVPWCGHVRISSLANTTFRSTLMGLTIIPATQQVLSKFSSELPQQRAVDSQREKRDVMYDSGIESRDIHLVTVSGKSYEEWEAAHDKAMDVLESQGFKPLHLTGGALGWQSGLATAGTLGVPLFS